MITDRIAEVVDPLIQKYLRLGGKYWRHPETGVIRRVTPKLRGKAAVKAHKRARQAARREA